MSKSIILSMAFAGSLFSVPASGQLKELRELEKELSWIDTAVFLMEHIPELSLNDKKGTIGELKKQSKQAPKDASKIDFVIEEMPDNHSLSQFAIFKLNIFEERLARMNLHGSQNLLFSELCRHAKRIFENPVYDGTVFDETPHIIYYAHRLAVRQMIQREADMEVLQNKLNSLSMRVDELCDSLVSSGAVMRRKVDVLTAEQQRDEQMNDLFYRKRLRHEAKRIPTDEAYKITSGLSYKQARKAVKKKIKTNK